ncbi:MAG: hypothetical protein ACOC42_03760 [Halobacteriota archaeon]
MSRGIPTTLLSNSITRRWGMYWLATSLGIEKAVGWLEDIAEDLPGVDELTGVFDDLADDIGFEDLPEFEWPDLPSFSWPDMPDFDWPSLPEFTWPSLPEFDWPELPTFEWPGLPSWEWPSIPRPGWLDILGGGDSDGEDSNGGRTPSAGPNPPSRGDVDGGSGGVSGPGSGTGGTREPISMQSGGFIPRGREVNARLHGPEAVVPLDRIQQATANDSVDTRPIERRLDRLISTQRDVIREIKRIDFTAIAEISQADIVTAVDTGHRRRSVRDPLA